jgi:hypothetical protein
VGDRHNHRDKYLDQQQTEKIETEMKDVDKIGWKAGKEAKAKVKNPRFSKDNTGAMWIVGRNKMVRDNL